MSVMHMGMRFFVVLLFCLVGGPVEVLAAQSPQVWTTNVVPGEYPSQQAALMAVRAQGGKYALAERVEDFVQTNDGTTYVYGANPREPQVGEWDKYNMQSADNGPYASEEAAINDVIAKYDGIASICSDKTVVKPSSMWAIWKAWYNGENYEETRHYVVEKSVPPTCYRNTVASQAWRFRAIECPQYTAWNSVDKACVAKDIARISTRPMVCSAGDLQHNPCNISTGDKYQSETDLSLPWVTFTRHYHSSHSVPDSGLGAGWTHEFNQRLKIIKGTSAGLLLPNGYVLPFRNGEAIDGSGWRLSLVAGAYEIYKPTQKLKFIGGRLVEIDNKGDGVLTLQYDSENRLATVIHSSGRALGFEYGAGSYAERARLSSIVIDGRPLVDYIYDVAGRLQAVRHDDGSLRRYHYEDLSYPNYLTGITDENGQRYSIYAYNADGLVTLSEHAGGVFRGAFNYQSDGATIFSSPEGLNRTFRFADEGPYRKVTEIADAEGRESTVYAASDTDFRRRPISKVDRLGTTTTYAYFDGYDSALATNVRRTTTNDAVGSSIARTTVEWREFNNGWLLKRLEANRETLFQRNARGQVLVGTVRDLTVNASRTTTTTYCEQTDVIAGTCPRVGLVTSVQGPRTDIVDITRYTYYPSDAADCATSPTTCSHRKGDLWKVTNALGQVSETLAYDGAGRVLSVKDANGVVTDMSYHPRGWLTSRTLRGASAAEDRVTKIEYAPTGLVSKTLQPDGSFVAFTYDAAHRLTGIVDSAGNRIQYTLDNAGNRIKEDTKDANGSLMRTLSRVYNQLGQLATQADAQANPTDFGYDANGNTKTVTDALGRVTQNDYDPLNRLTRTLQDVKGLQVETKFQYDALDNLVQVTDPKGLNTRYSYNALGDLLKLESPDTGITTYAYSSGGNRISQTDARGVTTSYSYDVLNRLTQVSYGGASPAISYSYDQTSAVCGAGETFNQGRLTGMSDGSGSTAYCYDRYGQLARKVQTTAGRSHTLRYAYTKAGQLSRITYPDGSVIDYGRNGQGQIAEVGITPTGQARQVLLNQTRHHAFGPVATWTYGNGRRMDRTLDQNYQPKAIEDANNGGLSLGFGFDAVGQLVKLRTADNVDPPIAKFDYDTLGRLTAFKDGYTDVAIETYGYDKTGNRTQLKNASGTIAYSYPASSHRLDKVGAEVRSYDAMGNTVAIGGERSFNYDAWGRMTQVKRNNAVAMTYAYNGRGEQVRRYQGTTDTAFVYDESGRLLGEYGSDGKPLKQYLWMDDLPVGLLAEGKLHYVQPDHLGTPRVVIDPQRDIAIWKWDLRGEAFGNTVPDEDADGDGKRFTFDLRFPGQRYDAASGLNYNYFRDYEAGTGRYVQSDPIGLNGGVSTYAYVTNSPLKLIDKNGLYGFDASCNSTQRAKIISEMILLNNELKRGDGKLQCPAGLCNSKLSADVMDFLLNDAYFTCKSDRLNGACAGNVGREVIYDPKYLGAPPPSILNDPYKGCGCFRSSLFHEAAHAVRNYMTEDDVRRKTRECVSCAANVNQNGDVL